MEVFSRKNITVLYFAILLNSQNVMATSDYMRLLQSEAADTSIDQNKKKNLTMDPDLSITNNTSNNIIKKDWLGECHYERDAVSSGLVEEEFYSYLKQCAMGTFIFYRQLDFKLQHLVYENYKKSAPMKLVTLRKDVLSYF